MPRIPGLRSAPWLMLAELAWSLRGRWTTLTPVERTRLTGLVKQTKGRPQNLTAAEKDDLKALVGKLDLTGLAKEQVPLVGRRMAKRGRRR